MREVFAMAMPSGCFRIALSAATISYKHAFESRGQCSVVKITEGTAA
jgi:hypothetical protein